MAFGPVPKVYDRAEHCDIGKCVMHQQQRYALSITHGLELRGELYKPDLASALIERFVDMLALIDALIQHCHPFRKGN